MDTDIDSAHFAIHVRMVRVIDILFTPRARLLLRLLSVINCIFCCCLLVFLHTSYVCNYIFKIFIFHFIVIILFLNC